MNPIDYVPSMESNFSQPELWKCANDYRELGWCIIPVGAAKCKQATVRWKQFQERYPTEKEWQAWQNRKNVTGIAVLLGAPSQNLYARDFDELESYQNWAKYHPDLAVRLPTARTARGCHVYFCSTQLVKFRKFKDGELQSDGHYCVLPPSKHQTGIFYEWIVAPSDSPLEPLPLESTGLNGLWNVQSRQSLQSPQSGPEQTERAESGGPILANRLPSLNADVCSLEEAVKAGLATEENTSHNKLWQFARALLSFQLVRGSELTQAELDRAFLDWYEGSKPFLKRNLSRDVYFAEFHEARERAKVPLGLNMQLIFEKAKGRPTPKCAQRFDNPEIHLTLQLCAQLQEIMGAEPFFLAGRTLQDFLQKDTHSTACMWLKLLCRAGILQRIKTREDNAMKAFRYRYLGDT